MLVFFMQESKQLLFDENKHIKQATKEIAEHFEGNIKNFTVELYKLSTKFQCLVWENK